MLTFQKWKEENYIWTWKGGKENFAVQQLLSNLPPPTQNKKENWDKFSLEILYKEFISGEEERQE